MSKRKPTARELAKDWNYDSMLVSSVREILLATPMTWLQAVTELSYCLACAMAGCEDDSDLRRRVGGNIAEAILDVAITGEVAANFQPPRESDGEQLH